jgi:hypothetical protein
MPLVWILAALAVIFIVETVLTEKEHWEWATVILIGTGVACHFFTPFSPWTFIKLHGPWTTLYVLAYLAIGVLWSFAKWFSYLRAFRDTFREQKEAFLKSKKLPAGSVVPDDLITAFQDYLRHNIGYVYSGLSSLERPRANNNKLRITAWMAYWPCSAIGTILNDPVRRIFNWIFARLRALYQKLADHVFRNDVELK